MYIRNVLGNCIYKITKYDTALKIVKEKSDEMLKNIEKRFSAGKISLQFSKSILAHSRTNHFIKQHSYFEPCTVFLLQML